jgi:hypothetical protein
VLSHVTERAVVEGGARRVAVGQPLRTASVGALFETAVRDGIALRVLMPGTAAEPPAGLPPAATARIVAALAAGYVVILPEQVVELDGQSLAGWWQVDPSTGEAIDALEDGRGAALLSSVPERVPVAQVSIEAAPAYEMTARCVTLVFFGSTLLLASGAVMAAGEAVGGQLGAGLVNSGDAMGKVGAGAVVGWMIAC